ncbi:hypothetical protein J3E68DRAFT_419469 [Trichoderma sp. SZMC 28012]
MCQGPNREGGSGHQKKNEDENEDGRWGMWVLFMSCLFCSFTLFHLLFLFIYIPFLLLPVIKGCCFLLLLAVRCVCTTAQKVPDIHSLYQGGG